MDGDETPRVSTSHTGTAILNLPVPLGIQPHTFGGPLVPTMQPTSTRCKHRPRVDGHPMCLKRPWRPLLSANDHPARYVGESNLQ